MPFKNLVYMTGPIADDLRSVDQQRCLDQEHRTAIRVNELAQLSEHAVAVGHPMERFAHRDDVDRANHRTKFSDPLSGADQEVDVGESPHSGEAVRLCDHVGLNVHAGYMGEPRSEAQRDLSRAAAQVQHARTGAEVERGHDQLDETTAEPVVVPVVVPGGRLIRTASLQPLVAHVTTVRGARRRLPTRWRSGLVTEDGEPWLAAALTLAGRHPADGRNQDQTPDPPSPWGEAWSMATTSP